MLTRHTTFISKDSKRFTRLSKAGHVLCFLFPTLTLLTACMGEDRSGEQPFAPTVKTLDATAAGDSALLRGQVLTSPNSDVTACGFSYGNDTLRKTVACTEVATVFEAYTDSLGAGDYFAVAYATNGIGTTYADTVYFTITH